MKKFILLAFCSLIGCQNSANPANCITGNQCQNGFYCDAVSEICKPGNFTLQTQIFSPVIMDAQQIALEDMNGDGQQDIVIKSANAIWICYVSKDETIQCSSPLNYTLSGKSLMRILAYSHGENPSILIIPLASTNINAQFFHNTTVSSPSFASPVPYSLNAYNINDVMPITHVVDRIGMGNINPQNDLLIATETNISLLPFTATPGVPTPISYTGLRSMVRAGTTNSDKAQIAGMLVSGGVGVIDRGMPAAATLPKAVTALKISQLRAADLNTDNTLDLIGATGDTVGFYSSLGRTDGSYPELTPISTASAAFSSFEVAPLVTSGNMGLVVLSDRKNFSYVPGNGDGTFGDQTVIWQSAYDVAVFNSVALFAVKDLDSDGKLDLVYVTVTGEIKVAFGYAP